MCAQIIPPPSITWFFFLSFSFNTWNSSGRFAGDPENRIGHTKDQVSDHDAFFVLPKKRTSGAKFFLESDDLFWLLHFGNVKTRHFYPDRFSDLLALAEDEEEFRSTRVLRQVPSRRASQATALQKTGTNSSNNNVSNANKPKKASPPDDSDSGEDLSDVSLSTSEPDSQNPDCLWCEVTASTDPSNVSNWDGLFLWPFSVSQLLLSNHVNP